MNEENALLCLGISSRTGKRKTERELNAKREGSRSTHIFLSVAYSHRARHGPYMGEMRDAYKTIV
jgi:hypothetical protein